MQRPWFTISPLGGLRSIWSFVCLSVHSHILKNHATELHQFLCMLPVAVARSPSTAICYTLCTSGFVDEVDFQTVGMVHGSCVFVVSGESVTASQISDQILLDEKSQQLRIAGCAPGGGRSLLYTISLFTSYSGIGQGRLTPHYGWEINPPPTSDTLKHTSPFHTTI